VTLTLVIFDLGATALHSPGAGQSLKESKELDVARRGFCRDGCDINRRTAVCIPSLDVALLTWRSSTVTNGQRCGKAERTRQLKPRGERTMPHATASHYHLSGLPRFRNAGRPRLR
jgi:hypothetical protein